MPQQPHLEPLRRWDPEQVGGFVLVGRLGAGAMGQVYLGRSAAGRLVAVKTIKTELAEEPDFRNRFGQEVAAARRVSGAFTAAVVAADSEADVPWLATVYVPAPSLSKLVRTCGPIPVRGVRWLAAGCAEALESIHSVGLVHRDLKPANVLVSPDGPRVIDFGVARAVERIELTVTRGSIGTPAYMAPEQARDTRQATSASDVFALGATMLFAATGHAPYEGETVMDVLVQLATGPPDLDGLPDELAGIVGACLERDPRNRPTSASILARLAPTLEAGGPAPLPAAALALVDEYRRVPEVPVPGDAADHELHTTGNAATGDDDTLGSQPLGARRATDSSPPPARPLSARPRSARLTRRLVLTVGTVVAAAALIGAGWELHTHSPASQASQTAAQGSTGRHDTASTSPSAGSPAPSSGNGAPVSDDHDLGPMFPPPPGQTAMPGVPQLPQGVTPEVLATQPSVPFIALNQVVGDGNTGFVIHGGNWPPGKPVSITLVGVGTSPDHPVADRAGTINYAINQAHEFFRGGLPPGTYTVRVEGPGGTQALARFLVQGQG